MEEQTVLLIEHLLKQNPDYLTQLNSNPDHVFQRWTYRYSFVIFLICFAFRYFLYSFSIKGSISLNFNFEDTLIK